MRYEHTYLLLFVTEGRLISYFSSQSFISNRFNSHGIFFANDLSRKVGYGSIPIQATPVERSDSKIRLRDVDDD